MAFFNQLGSNFRSGINAIGGFLKDRFNAPSVDTSRINPLTGQTRFVNRLQPSPPKVPPVRPIASLAPTEMGRLGIMPPQYRAQPSQVAASSVVAPIRPPVAPSTPPSIPPPPTPPTPPEAPPSPTGPSYDPFGSPEGYRPPQQELAAPLPPSTYSPFRPSGDGSTDRNQQLESLQRSYIASLGQSPEEIAAQRAISDLAASRELGMATVAEQPIETGFITGQQAAIERRAALQSLPLSARLAALQAQRASEQERAKAELGFEQERTAGETPIEVGGALVRRNPLTGAYEEVYRAPGGGIEPVTLSEGQRLIDPSTGREIAAGFPKTENILETEERRLRIAKLSQELSSSGLSPQQVSTALKLADDYNQASKEYSTQTSSYNRILSSAGQATPAGDLSMIFAYMKMLDPGSVVRESEFSNAATAKPLLERMGISWNAVQAVWKGKKLTDGQRLDFFNTAKNIYDSATVQQQNLIDEYSRRATMFNVPPEAVLTNFGSAQPSIEGSISGDSEYATKW